MCVQNHLEKKNHIPKCMQNLLGKEIKNLAKKVEFEAEEAKTPEEFWKAFDKDKFVKETLEKHK